MKPESEIDVKILYTQGYLDALRFALNKTEPEIQQVIATTTQDKKNKLEREGAQFWAPIGITAGLAVFFFGLTTEPKDWTDIIAGVVLIVFGFALTGIYFRLLKESLN